MKAWAVGEPGPVDGRPLLAVERPEPDPAAAEIRIRVRACGVCRTDLHVVEGDLPVHRRHVVPGHEIVGTVDALGADATRFAIGQRVGVPWLRHTCGRCRWCRRGAENLCDVPRFTGWDDDGGYAEWAVVDEAYAYGWAEFHRLLGEMKQEAEKILGEAIDYFRQGQVSLRPLKVQARAVAAHGGD